MSVSSIQSIATEDLNRNASNSVLGGENSAIHILMDDMTVDKKPIMTRNNSLSTALQRTSSNLKICASQNYLKTVTKEKKDAKPQI